MKTNSASHSTGKRQENKANSYIPFYSLFHIYICMDIFEFFYGVVGHFQLIAFMGPLNVFYIEPWLLSFDTAMNAISFTSITLLQIVTFNTAYITTFIHTIYITNPCLLHPKKGLTSLVISFKSLLWK